MRLLVAVIQGATKRGRARFAGALLVALVAQVAPAEPDTVLFGDGHSGARVVAAPRTVVNHYAALAQPVAPGDLNAQVSAAVGFTSGDLVMLLQMQSVTLTPDSGAPDPVDLNADGVGRFEFARVASMVGVTMNFTRPIVGSFPRVSQVVLVPEYTDFTVTDAGSVVAAPWDGYTGGVLALLCTGTLTNHGALEASHTGGRGGLGGLPVGSLCTGLDDPGAATKGESVVEGRFGALVRGKGNLANGGGGGDCSSRFMGGGGGGAHLGRGGIAGDTVFGFGGAPLLYPAATRLMLGGGGGAAASVSLLHGGAGGGIVFVRCGEFVGAGTVRATGERGAQSIYPEQGGGGGAGGAIQVQVAARLTCGAMDASGGSGGESRMTNPGGGGGGGVVVLQGRTISCAAMALAGLGGQGGGLWTGATPTSRSADGHMGQVLVLSNGLGAPVGPRITSPVDRQTVTTNRPDVVGTATPDTDVRLYVDGLRSGLGHSTDAGDFSVVP